MSRRLSTVPAVVASHGACRHGGGRELAPVARAWRAGHFERARLPTEWQPEQERRVEGCSCRHGDSSPIVWGDRIFLTAAIEGEVVPGQRGRRASRARASTVAPRQRGRRQEAHVEGAGADTKTGKSCGSRPRTRGRSSTRATARSSFAGPTPITDGKMVFAYFGPEGLYAYDIDGQAGWKVVEKFHTLGLGTGTSPVLFENLVIIQRDEDNGEHSALVAYDKKTGKEVWKTKRTGADQLGTPVLVNTGRTHRARDERQRVHHRLRSRDR